MSSNTSNKFTIPVVDATGAKPTRSAGTIARYRKEAARLCNRVDPERRLSASDRILAVAAYFQGAHGRWTSATIGVMRASVRQMAEDLAAADSIDTFTMSHVVTTTTTGPTPKAKNAPKLASARKRRSISQEERSQLVMHLAAGKTTAQRLLAGLVGLSSIIPIRPSEWRRARVKHGHLFVVCGKRSNGRAIARVRRVRLEDSNLIVAATRLIERLRAELKSAGSWECLYARLAKALTRACKSIGIRTICLYTLRRQAIATSKRHYALEIVAALAGQASIKTPSRSYAKSRSGWGERPKLSVPPRLVECVRGSGSSPGYRPAARAFP